MKMKLRAPLKAEVFRPTSNPKCGNGSACQSRGEETKRERVREEEEKSRQTVELKKYAKSAEKCLKSFRNADYDDDADDYDDDGQIKMFVLV